MMAGVRTNQLAMRENMGPIQEEIIAKNAHQERMEASMNAWREGSKACLERKEPTPMEMANVAAQLKDLNGEMCEEMVWATDDLSKDRRLTVRRHRQLKKRTQGVGGSQKKSVAAHGWMTRRTIFARHKGHCHKGPTGEKRRRKK
jgi:hypothetical protein